MTQKTDNPSFTANQKEYLQGFFSGISARQRLPFAGHTAGGLITHQAAPGMENLAAEPVEDKEPEVYGTPLSDLCKEEVFKYEQNGLDVWEKLVAHADANKAPEPDDLFRFKFHGLFYVAPAQDSFMLRVRIPAGILRADQMAGMADMAEDWGGGYCDVTTRANLQIREFAPKNIINVLTKVQELGLTSRGSGADNIRNVTATPTSGLDPQELLDVVPYAKALHYYILNHRDMYGLPRKFNVSFDSGGAVSTVADTNDIAFVAVKVLEGNVHQARVIEPGIYFRVQLAGITGHMRFAVDTGLLVTPEESVAVAAALIRVFNENGDRTNRKRARLCYALERLGMEKYLEETQKKLAFALRYLPLEVCELRPGERKHGHLGVHAQKQAGRVYVGVAIPVGRLTVAQMRGLAEASSKYAGGEMRLTVWQNLLLPNVLVADVPHLERELAAVGLGINASSVAGGVIACTGNTGCKFAATNTKGQALLLAKHLDSKITLDSPINIHLTGCPHSCAQHYIADIGMLGASVGEPGSEVEGYHIYVGGGSGDEQGMGRELAKNVPFTEIPGMMEKLLAGYQRSRQGSESFLEFARRQDVDALKELITP